MRTKFGWAKIALLQLYPMSFPHHGFGQDMETLHSVADPENLSFDDFHRIKMEPDRTYILCEETRERMTSLMISVMNSQKVG